MAECFERKAKGKLRSYRMKMTHRIHGLTVGVLGLLLSACVPSNPFTEGRARVADTGAKAQFVDAKGQWLGTLTISPQSGGGVRLTGWLVELPQEFMGSTSMRTENVTHPIINRRVPTSVPQGDSMVSTRWAPTKETSATYGCT